ncbi:OmpA family protein [Mucilaginibacter arboris]|uniref:OmpA family protein n=1 Tax=Mucilaginibacter arboris TaxID=2682090 RepID=A0A7K1T1R0_9SPHI|nr:OmpA family protein [Mucilaginibacter arboris]MVN23441.1 OmpA family protein [Mucilaginibacter arboris]
MKTKVFFIAPLALLLFLSEVKAIDVSSSKKTVRKVRAIDKSALIAEVTRNLEYDFAKASIRNAYYDNLNKLVKLVIEDDYVVSLRGHADSIGKYKPNWVLSEKRALAVKNYLVSKGVKKDRVVAIPYGSTIPIATNKTPEGRQKNRRVEIRLKEINK